MQATDRDSHQLFLSLFETVYVFYRKSYNLDLVRFKTKFELKILDPDYPSTYFPM